MFTNLLFTEAYFWGLSDVHGVWVFLKWLGHSDKLAHNWLVILDIHFVHKQALDTLSDLEQPHNSSVENHKQAAYILYLIVCT